MNIGVRILIFLGLFLALVTGIVKEYEHTVNVAYQRGINAQAAICTAAENKELRAAQERLAGMTRKYEEAQNAAVEREKVLAGVVSAAAAASEQLRGAIHKTRDRLQSDTTTCPSLRLSGLALSSIFEDCADKYRDVAKAAGGHAEDVRKLLDAWPR